MPVTPYDAGGGRSFEAWTLRNDIREFLTTRRARLTPEQVGLPDFGGRRRVPGLRREEVALVAGMSVEYYVRLERGNATGVSEAVLEGISRALQLDDAERAHLYDLVRAANEGSRPAATTRAPQERSRSGRACSSCSTRWTTCRRSCRTGGSTSSPSTGSGRRVFSEMYVQPQRPANFGRFLFLDPRAHALLPRLGRRRAADRRAAAQPRPAALRTTAYLSDLVGELSTRSDAFRTLWASHDVREHRTGVKAITHPVVGDLDLDYEAMDLSSDRGLLLLAYTAEPGSASHDALQLLASWAATDDQVARTSPGATETTNGT